MYPIKVRVNAHNVKVIMSMTHIMQRMVQVAYGPSESTVAPDFVASEIMALHLVWALGLLP